MRLLLGEKCFSPAQIFVGAFIPEMARTLLEIAGFSRFFSRSRFFDVSEV